jgi:hypothetical protein
MMRLRNTGTDYDLKTNSNILNLDGRIYDYETFLLIDIKKDCQVHCHKNDGRNSS